jgi:hypothetical protein
MRFAGLPHHTGGEMGWRKWAWNYLEGLLIVAWLWRCWWWMAVVVFVLGAWAGAEMIGGKYERIISLQGRLDGERCRARVVVLLEEIDMQHCARWDVSTPAFTDADIVGATIKQAY